MKKIFLCFFFLLSFSFFLVSCHCKKKATSDTATIIAPDRNFEQEGYTKATVINYTVDGCSYMLQLAEGKMLEPRNLSPDFKKDKLNVWVKYALKKGAISICMAGPVVEISDIQLRK